jgi:uncharacterized protein (UPF0276 family)
MMSGHESFMQRAARIPLRGIGLSVDVYDPDLLELHRALDRAGARPDYLEIFKARTPDLARMREALPDTPLAYHAEGLWLIDPDVRAGDPWSTVVETIARHTKAIGADWVNHECAAKQFGGYSFGTYLPPLFLEAAAEVTAANAVRFQGHLDEWYAEQGCPDAAPLVLLELPPLIFFAFGDLPVAEFFTRLVRAAPCGLVLDLGHLWTVWRYRERRRCRTLEAFAADFFDAFPLDRVVQIHLAGLAPTDPEDSAEALPVWVDAHAAPVPEVLFDLLRMVLACPDLTSLKGIALEVDTKAIPLIVEEFRRLRSELAGRSICSPATVKPGQKNLCLAKSDGLSGEGRHEERLADLYRAYGRVVSGQEALPTSTLAPFAEEVETAGLARYTTRYLPRELVTWGGDLKELFPRAWRELEARGLTGGDFVRSWFREPRLVTEAYDYFYVKLERWVAFVGEVAPDLLEETAREAVVLRALHAKLNDETVESKA